MSERTHRPDIWTQAIDQPTAEISCEERAVHIWLMWSLRALMPRRSSWRVAQFDTLRLRLIKLAARVEVLKRKVQLHLPRATPDQTIFALVLARMPRLTI